MADQAPTDPSAPLRVGSLFSGYGGLDFAAEEVFGAKTIWFSEINEPVARVFSHHWPDAPNLGDITTIDWNTVPPVDILCGGFPCQDVSTVGKMTGLKPGTRSGLWAHMAEAIDTLRPEWVVIENVRGLLSAPAIRTNLEGDNDEQRNPGYATPTMPPLAVWNPTRGIWEKTAPRPLRAAGAVLGDLADLRYDAQWLGLPASLIGAPHPRYRVFILAHRTLPHPTRLRRSKGRGDLAASESTPRHDRTESPDHLPRFTRVTRLPADRGTREPVEPDRAALQRWGRYAEAVTRWERITGRPAPAPALFNDTSGPRPAPAFVEWLMGLEIGWVTAPSRGLSTNQQLAALGNGVQPLQAVSAITSLLSVARRTLSSHAVLAQRSSRRTV
ncbi:hypothetical protein GCM10027421_28510 [Microbacterium shaanxiense]